MMKRTGLVLLGVLHSALLWGAAESGESGTNFWYVLRRIVNPKQRVLIEGGTHNSVHFSCENKGTFSHGFLNPGKDHDCDILIPVEEFNAILLSVAKHRLSLFQAQSKRLVVRRFEKGNTDKFTDELLNVEGLPQFLNGEYPVVIEILHGGKIACKYSQAGVSKSTNRVVSMPVAIHMPPEASGGICRGAHSIGCMCGGCMQQLSPPPSSPAPSYQKPLPTPPSLYTPSYAPHQQQPYRQNPFTQGNN